MCILKLDFTNNIMTYNFRNRSKMCKRKRAQNAIPNVRFPDCTIHIHLCLCSLRIQHFWFALVTFSNTYLSIFVKCF